MASIHLTRSSYLSSRTWRGPYLIAAVLLARALRTRRQAVVAIAVLVIPLLLVWRTNVHAWTELIPGAPQAIAVPTPPSRNREPDVSYIERAARDVGPHLRKGHLVVLESTTYPGTTRDRLAPILEASGEIFASPIRGTIHACGHDAPTADITPPPSHLVIRGGGEPEQPIAGRRVHRR